MTARSKKEVAPHVGVPTGPHIEEYLVKPHFDDDGVQVSSAIGLDGKEYPDPVPMSPPVGYTPPNDLMWMLQHMIRQERFAQEARAADVETEEEANDFDLPDDPLDELTHYEKVFLPPDPPSVTPQQNGAPQANSPPAASPAATSSSNSVASSGHGNTSDTGAHKPDSGTSASTPVQGSHPAG